MTHGKAGANIIQHIFAVMVMAICVLAGALGIFALLTPPIV